MQTKIGIKTWLIALVGVILAVRTGANVWRLWKLGDKVTGVQQQVTEAEAENKTLTAKLEYVKSPGFVEKEARDKLGFGKDGETILVVPDQESTPSSIQKVAGTEMPNWKMWLKLYITN